MGKVDPNSLRSRCLAAVLGIGDCEISEVVARVGQHISAAKAAAAGRRQRRGAVTYHSRERPAAKPTGRSPSNKKELQDSGRRRLVSEALMRLARQGKIRRLGHGRYAPPAPKVYRPLEVG